MTKKDYILLAKALKKAFENTVGSEQIGVRCAMVHISNALAADNPRFLISRFEAACSPEVGDEEDK